MKYPAVQCLTLDTLTLSHESQVRALCESGAKWVQLRMKEASDPEVAAVAAACRPVCRAVGCRLIINDRVEVALQVDADGVHLGLRDMSWAKARALLGPDKIIGGTVNSLQDSEQAVASGVLDYVGVGPFRMTYTKKNPAPVLSTGELEKIIQCVRPIPAFAIGGIQVSDIVTIRSLGLQGVAVASALYRDEAVAANYKGFINAWMACPGGRKASRW